MAEKLKIIALMRQKATLVKIACTRFLLKVILSGDEVEFRIVGGTISFRVRSGLQLLKGTLSGRSKSQPDARQSKCGIVQG